MALSNKFGWLVVATGNKSELSVGYATLYGDMAGGFALLKDVFKTDVFRLSRHLNERAGRELIPQSIIDRAPSAELRADQLDEDSLPPYAELDRVLEAYVELDRSREEPRRRVRPGRRRASARDDRPRRVQAPAGAAGREAPPEGVRPRPAHADHEPLAAAEAARKQRSKGERDGNRCPRYLGPHRRRRLRPARDLARPRWDAAARERRIRPALILAHFGLAAAGLVLWIVYVATDSDALAWVAFVLLAIVAALGWTMFFIWWRQRQARQGGAPAAAERARRPSSASRFRSSRCTECSRS